LFCVKYVAAIYTVEVLVLALLPPTDTPDPVVVLPAFPPEEPGPVLVTNDPDEPPDKGGFGTVPVVVPDGGTTGGNTGGTTIGGVDVTTGGGNTVPCGVALVKDPDAMFPLVSKAYTP
jgi:hypothetical protein